MAAWKPEFNPGPLCNRLEKVKKPTTSGSVSFSGFDALLLRDALAGMLVFRAEVPEHEHVGLAMKACGNAGKAGPITPKRVLSCLQVLEKDYLKLPIKTYYLVTHLSLPLGLRKSALMVSTSRITFPRSESRIELETMRECMHSSEDMQALDLPGRYQVVRVTTSGRTKLEAGDKALDRLDLLRAAWNVGLNRRHTFRLSTGRQLPVNQITLGPIQALFESRQVPISDSWWYEPAYKEEVLWKDASRDMQAVEKFRRRLFRWLRQSKYRADLEGCLLRYVRALDLRDWHAAFLRLWGLLETLTASDAHKVVVRRAASLHPDQDMVVQELHVLRNLRNRHAHAGHLARNPEHWMYRAKRFVEVLLMFHLSNEFGFSSMTEAGEFLDLPPSKTELTRRARMCRYALKIRS